MWITRLDGGPKKVNHAAVAIDDKIYSFGGYCSGEDFESNRPMEIYVLQTATLRWKALPPPTGGFDEDCRQSQVPFHRYGHSAVVWQQCVLIWGGRNDLDGACNTLYVYDTQRAVWWRPAVQGIVPEKRDGHAATILGDDMYIFGGFEEQGDRFSSELYRLHIPTMTWHHVVPAGLRPMPRDFATMQVVDGHLLLWGGRGDLDEEGLHTGTEKYENFLHEYDVEHNAWLHHVLRYAPPARRSHASFLHQGRMHIFGGFNGRDHFNDLWVFDQRLMRWNEIKFGSSPVVPCPRRRMCCCVVEDRLFLFGGTSPANQIPEAANLLADNGLVDHEDLCMMEFLPRLDTLAMVAVIRHQLPTTRLPFTVRLDLLVLTTPNSLSPQQRLRAGNHSG
ncbi:kelch domain-containing protein 3-like [Paramacrobiotus metropolitanus]|uniref:kelch domain-containing protein 3-like n=1 Tax=Paramacrobiotus metropolitanus TaxID=2943436 RepID=UPI0024464332|nr:kelch domain-containing protein 3-like [Paramacrobiotus metropolitanus]